MYQDHSDRPLTAHGYSNESKIVPMTLQQQLVALLTAAHFHHHRNSLQANKQRNKDEFEQANSQ